jgi:prefoldin alpha subunit
MENQEYIMRMQMIEQEASKLDQQIQAIDQQMSELVAIKSSIKELESTKEKDMMANLGKGIFVKAELKGKEMFVNVGKDVLVKKTPTQTIKVIEEQLTRLELGKVEFSERILQLQSEMHKILEEARRNRAQAPAHACENEDCECEEPCDDCDCGHEHHNSEKKKK